MTKLLKMTTSIKRRITYVKNKQLYLAKSDTRIGEVEGFWEKK